MEELLSYSQVMDHIEKNGDSGEDGIYWRFRRIVGHEKVSMGDKNYKGSCYNLWIEWENGEITFLPLAIFFEDAPYECAMYAINRNLLDEPGWKRCKPYARKRNCFKASTRG